MTNRKKLNAPYPRHEFITEDLARRIAKSEWPLGKRIPSFRQFALHYGVSIGTIQRAFQSLRADGLVSVAANPPTRASLAAPLAKVMEDTIVRVLNTTLAEFCNETWPAYVLRGVERAVGEAGVPLLILQRSSCRRDEFPAGIRHLPLKGILLFGPFVSQMLHQYESLPIPIVILDQPPMTYNLHSVSIANYDAAHDAALRLIALGHRRIAFLRRVVWSLHDLDPDGKERQAGFQHACAQSGLKESEFRILTTGMRDPGMSIRNALRATPRITAFLATDCACAALIADAAKAEGLQIPRDLSITTFSSVRPVDRNWTGPQTDFEEIGRAGVSILMSKPKNIKSIRVSPTWNAGETVSRPSRA